MRRLRRSSFVRAGGLVVVTGAFVLDAAVCAQDSPTSPSQLAGTSWQLVKFQGSDDRTLTPDDRTKYTIEFATSGNLNARIDCNRGRGTWKSSGSSQIQFGVLALTRARCRPGSLHDQIVKQWPNVRSYVIKDGHLFLALVADGGVYEFEPTGKMKQQEQNRLREVSGELANARVKAPDKRE